MPNLRGPDWIKQISVNLTMDEVDALDEITDEVMTDFERKERKFITRSETVRRLIRRHIAKKNAGVRQ